MASDILMIEECCSSYEAKEVDGGGVEILIKAEHRFADLWIVKLNGLMTTEEEIAYYGPGPGKEDASNY